MIASLDSLVYVVCLCLPSPAKHKSLADWERASSNPAGCGGELLPAASDSSERRRQPWRPRVS